MNAWVAPFVKRFIKDAANPIPLRHIAFEFGSSGEVNVAPPVDLSALYEILKSSTYIPRTVFKGLNSDPSMTETFRPRDILAGLAPWSGEVLFS